MFDGHIHTMQSCDCDTRVEDACRTAFAADVTAIAFTDPIEHEPADPDLGSYDHSAFLELSTAREEFGHRLVMLSGTEVD